MTFKYTVECELDMNRNEFGFPVRGFLHYVIATAPDGSRFAHFHAEVGLTDLTPSTTARLLKRIRAAAPDPRASLFWSETAPVAGSPADLAKREDEARFAAMEDEAFGRFASGGNIGWD